MKRFYDLSAPQSKRQQTALSIDHGSGDNIENKAYDFCRLEPLRSYVSKKPPFSRMGKFDAERDA